MGEMGGWAKYLDGLCCPARIHIRVAIEPPLGHEAGDDAVEAVVVEELCVRQLAHPRHADRRPLVVEAHGERAVLGAAVQHGFEGGLAVGGAEGDVEGEVEGGGRRAPHREHKAQGTQMAEGEAAAHSCVGGALASSVCDDRARSGYKWVQ